MIRRSTWRSRAQAIIREIVNEIGTDDEKAFRDACYRAYGKGPRQYYPYKVWCQEVRRALGQLKPKPIKPKPIPEGQETMFDDLGV